MYGEFCREPPPGEGEEEGAQKKEKKAKKEKKRKAVAAKAPSSSSSSSSSRSAPAASSPAAASAALAAARAAVASAVSSVLGPGVADDTPLADAGLDSLGAVDLRNALARNLASPEAAAAGGGAGTRSVELPVTLAYDHPTPAALAVFVARELAPLMLVDTESEGEVRGVVEEEL